MLYDNLALKIKLPKKLKSAIGKIGKITKAVSPVVSILPGGALIKTAIDISGKINQIKKVYDETKKIKDPTKRELLQKALKEKYKKLQAKKTKLISQLKPKQKRYFRLFDPRKLTFSELADNLSTSKEDKKSIIKVERKKLLKNLKKVENNWKYVYKKLTGGVFGRHVLKDVPELDKKLTNKMQDIKNRIKAIKKELKDIANLKQNLSQEPLIAVGLETGITILKKYNNEIINLNNQIKKVNKTIDRYLEGKITKAEIPKQIKTKPEKKLIDIKSILLPIALVGAGIILLPKILKKRS